MSIFAKQRVGLDPREKAVIAVLSALLVFLPWSWGGRELWGQFTALGLAVAAFMLAVLPRDQMADKRGDENRRLIPWLRLRRFPLFWLGLLLLALIVVQSLNPARAYTRNERVWWLRSLPHQALLPTSVIAPWESGNSWRVLLIFATVWLAVCAFWIGVSRRRALRLLLTVVSLNVVLVALVGAAHRLSGVREILWIRKFDGAMGFGPFIYHNHGGGFVALGAFAAVALAAWAWREETRRMARSSPALVWLLAGLFVVICVALSGSRGAAMLVVVFLALAAIAAWLCLRHATSGVPRSRVLIVLLVCGFLAWAGFLLRNVDFGFIVAKFEALQRDGTQELSYRGRVLARGAAAEMLSDHWFYGTGAGSFRYLFVPYVQKNPALKATNVWWDHAHIDWLEIPIEFGLVGCLLIGSSLIWCVWKWIQWRGWRHPIGLMLFLGCMQTMVHALVDFPFQNVAILITWWALVIIALRWIELDNLLDEARQESARKAPFLARN